MSNANILYTKPTYNKDYNLEDYSIVVSLEVELINNSSAYKIDDNNITYEYTYKSNNSSVNFLEGTQMSFINGKGELHKKNYLTTKGYDYSDIGELSTENGSKECFGISSIDISYNNYMIPEVTIEFIDIRGISLFIPEEIKHHKTSNINDVFITSVADDSIYGSFFKAFFTMPYPKFHLTVKGFYGEPVSYTLFCSDFRARFDCKSGNFAATARFVGYTLSLLNDITLNSLLVAPYSTYYGKQYWDYKINNDFMIDNKPMPTLIEIIEKYDKLKSNEKGLNINSTDFYEIQNIDSKYQNVLALSNSYTLFFKTLINFINNLKLNENEFKVTYDENNFNLLICSVNSNNIDITNQPLSNNYRNLIILKDNIISLSSYSLPNFISNDKITFKQVNNNFKNEIKDKKYKNLNFGNIDFDKYKHYAFFNGCDLNDKINSLKKQIEDDLNKYNNSIIEENNQNIIDSLGFKPTIKNITYIILAHLETLIFSLYKVSDDVDNSKRTQSQLNLNNSDINFDKYNGFVSAFPKVNIIKNKENGLKVIEERWIGDLTNGLMQPEAKLINSLLSGTKNIERVVKQSSLYNNEEQAAYDFIPTLPIDYINNDYIFSNNLNLDNFTEFIGALGIRMLQVVGLIDDLKVEKIAKADAFNFFKQYNLPSNYFYSRITSSNLDSKLILNSLLNKDESEKINSEWCWDKINDKVIDYYSTYYEYVLKKYIIGKDSYNNDITVSILPKKGMSWDELSKDLSTNTLPNDLTNYVVFGNNSKYNCNNYIKIDTDYLKYENLGEYSSYNNEKINESILQFKFNLSSYLYNYYGNKYLFCEKFKATNNNVSFIPFSGNCLFYDNRIENYENENTFIKTNKINKRFTNFLSKNQDTLVKISRGDKSVKDIEDISIIDNYTISSFSGIKDNSVVSSCSIFGQPFYYLQTNKYVRALLFLKTFEYNFNAFSDNTGLIRYDDCINKFVSLHNFNSIMHLPYVSILYMGGCLWINEQSSVPFIYDSDFMDRWHNYSQINDSLIKDVKLFLINEFKKWVNSDDGFKYIQEQLELHDVNNNTYSYDNLVRIFNSNLNNFDYNNANHFFATHFNDNFFKNYLSFDIDTENNKYFLKLYNREDSTTINYIVSLLVKPCLVIKLTKFFNASQKRLLLNVGYCNNYINSFLSELKNLYINNINQNDLVNNEITLYNVKEDINITYYKYIKLVWDRWLKNNNRNDWTLKNFSKHWYFIDSFYNKIGDDMLINIENFTRAIVYSQHQNTYSLLSFISSVYSKEKLMFHTVQNFLDIVGNDIGKNNMNNLFKAIPYCEANLSKRSLGDFIVMYTYEFSSKLNIENSDYVNDSYNISDEDELLPPQITSKNNNNGFKIPAFDVIYGNQEQKYFTNIDVSMDNPICTEQSLTAQYNIVSSIGQNSENNKNTVVLGQDLYTIYSNNSYTCTVQMMGCAWIQPLMLFQLNSIPLFKGTYLIEKVKHHIEPGNMLTEFVGVRMRRDVTSIMKSPYANKDAIEISGNNEINENNSNKLDASYTNSCSYKFFNPYVGDNRIALTENELNMSLFEYSALRNEKWSNNILNLYQDDLKIKTLLSYALYNKSNSEDSLMNELVATVMYNSYIRENSSIINMINKQDYLFNNNIKIDNIGFYEDIIKNVFTKTPIYLVNKKTIVNNPINIWIDGKKSDNMTEQVIINSNMLKTIDYCIRSDNYANDSFFIKNKYVMNHEDKNNSMIFISSTNNEYWNNSTSNASNSYANLLFQSIQKSIKYSNNNANLSFEPINDNSFYINSTNQDDLINTFDSIIDTYYNYFNKCYWIVKNDSNEKPSKIYVESNSANKRICIVRNSSNNFEVINEYENLNDNFYNIIKKRYNSLDNSNKNEFAMTFTNFTNLINTNEDWSNVINNNLKNITLLGCVQKQNLTQIDGYSWDGINVSQNKILPNFKIKTINPDDLGKIAYNNVLKTTNSTISSCGPKKRNTSCHQCAEWVRNAIEEAIGNNKLNNYPLSACVYSKFLPSWGFKEIYSNNSKNIGNFKPQNGDISVIAGKKVNDNLMDSHLHGHIQIYYNNAWYSDFECKTPWTYSDDRPFKIYRWLN